MTQPFIHEDFLLETAQARRLYHEVASDLPIIDYHCHLSPQELAQNKRFENLFEIWLAGDHYKWRAMRANGVDEAYCTGDAEPYEKFLAFAKTLPNALRNPLYHWSHLELKRYFDSDVLLDANSAPKVWETVNEQLSQPTFDTYHILKTFKVEMIGTTDDPSEPLPFHEQLQTSDLATRVLPSFRPDPVMVFDDLSHWNRWVDKLAQTAQTTIQDFGDLLAALKKRHDAFDELGCRLSDHGLEAPVFAPCEDACAARIFKQARAGEAISTEASEQFATYILSTIGRWNAARNWTMQLHIGAIRNNRSKLFHSRGRDIGFDSIGDAPMAKKLSAFLDALDQQDALPKTILYNLNPSDNYVFATMIGNFQDGKTAGKIQFGSGWWFLDQLEGMRMQLDALSTQGLLGRFVGMLTDSRSFMSYPRHEYFRRLLCNILGEEMQRGLIPDDHDLVSELVRNVGYYNAKNYLEI